MHTTLSEMFHRLVRAQCQSRAAKSVEYFGWLMLAESAALLFAPHFVAQVLCLPALSDQAANYFRLVGLLLGGLGMLYVASGRLNAEGFVFASMLDRPLVPPVMAILWYLGIMPGPLALLFAVSDLSSFLWTFFAWRAEQHVVSAIPRKVKPVPPRMEVATEVTIEASSAAVWRILADAQRYPQWNPYIRELHGEIVPAAALRFRFSFWGSITLPAQARVLTVTVERELRWAGHLLRDGLFRAEHYHLLDPLAERKVRFRHGERFSGVLAVLLWPFLRLWAPGRYRAANLALKQRAESALIVEQQP